MSRTIHLDGEGCDPEVGWLVRINGLANAKELNGQVALICGFITEKQRYEVELLESKEKKSIQGRNLAELAPLEEVKLCCQLLEKVNGISSEELLLRQLERLEEIHITPEILFETKVGKSMNDFSKRLSTDKPQAATKARQLWSKWKSDWKRARDEELKKQETQETQATQQSQKDSQGSEKQSEKVSESKQVKVPPTERCLAIDASKLQCKNRRHQPRFLCGLHQRMLDQNGQLEHGWIADSEAPNKAPAQPAAAAQAAAPVGAHGSHGIHGVRSDHAIRMKTNKQVADIQPMTGPEDAKKMVAAMRNVPSESVRMGLLIALDKSPRHCMLPFVQSGGVEILAKWLRKSEEACYACLMVLQKLPVTFADLQKADLIRIVEAIQSQDSIPHHRENATALLERWKAAGFLEPPSKKPRLDPPQRPTVEQVPTVPPTVAPTVAQPPPSTAVVPPGAQPRTPPLETLPAARPEAIPRELRTLDARIAQVLLDRPELYSFLQKHPGVFANLNAENLVFLQRLLRNGHRTRQEQDSSDVFGGVSVTVSGLAEESSAVDIQDLFSDINIQPLKISRPRESRRKKFCVTAFVLLESLEHATLAVDRLNGARLHQKILTVDFLEADRRDGPQESSKEERVKWKADSELMEVVVFSPDESVETLRERINKKDFQHQRIEHSQAVHSRFQAARRAEEMMEKANIQKAMAEGVPL